MSVMSYSFGHSPFPSADVIGEWFSSAMETTMECAQALYDRFDLFLENINNAAKDQEWLIKVNDMMRKSLGAFSLHNLPAMFSRRPEPHRRAGGKPGEVTLT